MPRALREETGPPSCPHDEMCRFFSVVVLEWLAEKLLVREIPFRERPGSGRQSSTILRRSDSQRMKKKGDHRPRNSAQYERVVELLILHKAKRTPRKISLLPSVSRPRSVIRQLRKPLTFFTAIPVFYRFRGEKRKRRVMGRNAMTRTQTPFDNFFLSSPASLCTSKTVFLL